MSHPVSVDVSVEEREVAVLLDLHGGMYIPVKAVQMAKNPLLALCSVRLDDRSVFNIT